MKIVNVQDTINLRDALVGKTIVAVGQYGDETVLTFDDNSDLILTITKKGSPDLYSCEVKTA